MTIELWIHALPATIHKFSDATDTALLDKLNKKNCNASNKRRKCIDICCNLIFMFSF